MSTPAHGATYTQAELDKRVEEEREESFQNGRAEGISAAANYVEQLVHVLEAGDEGHGYLEREIAILRWAQRCVGAL